MGGFFLLGFVLGIVRPDLQPFIVIAWLVVIALRVLWWRITERYSLMGRRTKRAGLQKRRQEMLDVDPMLRRQLDFATKDRELTERLHYLNNTPRQVQLNKLYNPPPPPVSGECTGCHLDSIYDLRQPYSKLCSLCVDLAEAKTYNMETWGATA